MKLGGLQINSVIIFFGLEYVIGTCIFNDRKDTHNGSLTHGVKAIMIGKSK